MSPSNHLAAAWLCNGLSTKKHKKNQQSGCANGWTRRRAKERTTNGTHKKHKTAKRVSLLLSVESRMSTVRAIMHFFRGGGRTDIVVEETASTGCPERQQKIVATAKSRTQVTASEYHALQQSVLFLRVHNCSHSRVHQGEGEASAEGARIHLKTQLDKP